MKPCSGQGWPIFTPLEKSRAEAQGKIKDSYTFSHGVNAPCEILLTGFTLFLKTIKILFAMKSDYGIHC